MFEDAFVCTECPYWTFSRATLNIHKENKHGAGISELKDELKEEAVDNKDDAVCLVRVRRLLPYSNAYETPLLLFWGMINRY